MIHCLWIIIFLTWCALIVLGVVSNTVGGGDEMIQSLPLDLKRNA